MFTLWNFYFRKSLKLEPMPKNQQKQSHLNASSSMTHNANSFCNLESGIASLNVSPAKSSSMRLNQGQPTKFSLGHRKTQSLGSKWVSTFFYMKFVFYCLWVVHPLRNNTKARWRTTSTVKCAHITRFLFLKFKSYLFFDVLSPINFFSESLSYKIPKNILWTMKIS